MSGPEPQQDPKQFAKTKTASDAQRMRGQTGTQLTVSGTFTTGLDASLDMSGIDDEFVGESTVDIYAANQATPNARSTAPGFHRGHYEPGPAHFPTNLNGGVWTRNANYWIQVYGPNGTWQGHITATQGTHDISLTKQGF